MLNRLWMRISLVIAVCVLIGPAALSFLTLYTTQPRSILNNIRENLAQADGVVARLGELYAENGNWEALEDYLNATLPPVPISPTGRVVNFVIANETGAVILNARGDDAGRVSSQELAEALPITVGDVRVGYLVVQMIDGEAPLNFPDFNSVQLSSFIRLVSLLVVVTTLISLVGGVLLSRTLAAPLDALEKVTRQFGQRNYGVRASVRGSEEMRAVARAFNEMADAIERSEQLRRSLTADIAHELRTPLTVVQANLQAILDDVYPLDKAEISRVYEQTELLVHLVADLRIVAQAEAGSLPLYRSVIDLRPMLDAVAAQFRTLAEQQSVRISIAVPPEPVHVDVDSKRIEQVLHNLIQNALTYTPAAGEITLRLEREANSARIDVSDTGTGIAPEHLSMIFERFYRADPSRSRDTGGSGLGLAVVKAMIEAHGGKVSAMSEGISGKGTTFTIHLPLVSTVQQHIQPLSITSPD